MDWNVGEAKQRFSEVLRQAEREPQRILNRDRLVAVVLSAEEANAFLAWSEERQRVPLAASLSELQRACAEEDYALEVPERTDRAGPGLGEE